jgi:hypothetical protein
MYTTAITKQETATSCKSDLRRLMGEVIVERGRRKGSAKNPPSGKNGSSLFYVAGETATHKDERSRRRHEKMKQQIPQNDPQTADFGMTTHKERAAGLKAAATETTSKSMTKASGLKAPALHSTARRSGYRLLNSSAYRDEKVRSGGCGPAELLLAGRRASE